MTGLEELKKRFYDSVLPARPNDWEVDEVFDQLADLPGDSCEVLLSQVGTIWPVSHSLCFSYLSAGGTALRLFPAQLIPEWVRQILGVYEKSGLVGARAFMAEIDRCFLGPMRGEAGVGLAEVASVLLPYIRGVSGLHVHLEGAAAPGTDTRTIYLPEHIDHFPEREKNVLLYKLVVSLQWGQIASGVYRGIADDEVGGQFRDPFIYYTDRKLARDLLAALQFRKAYALLTAELPGLVRQAGPLRARLIEQITPQEPGGRGRAMRNFLLRAVSEKEAARDSFELLAELYDDFAGLPGSYQLGPAALLLGELDFPRAGKAIRLRRLEEKRQFVAMLAAFWGEKGKKDRDPGRQEGMSAARLEDILLLLQRAAASTSAERKQQVLLDNEGTVIPEALIALAGNIADDLGSLPQAYVQAAAGMAGSGLHRQENSAGPETLPEASPAATTYRYDEWDYRRGGYRADWCTLEEKSLSPVRSAFVDATLAKYAALLKKLRRQFESLRTADRVVRRQREGDDIDLDAVIEALGDYRAGLIPSDRLFTRLLRDERNISTMFLVDMSSSTEGWVSVALKETLVLLAEALETVGDSYGIYGFSGMRRSRSELFHVKHLEESYGAVVQQRIAAIGPKDYTRMGPPIRHLTRKLLESQGRIRLLIVISDGKPEDYDDYKGQYAIEDTRKALLEAKGAGIHPFCITIDKSAHEYLAHMFGGRHYIFVNDVKSLPVKMVQMYRLLTS